MEDQESMQNVGTVAEEVTGEDLAHRGFSRTEVICVLVLAVLIVGGIVLGIHIRTVDGASLKTQARQNAVLSVDVVHPASGAASSEIVLPASVQAYTDTPVYARTSGYLRHWYADIGTRVAKGELLAEIETPELDQQVQQAQSDLLTAEANYRLAQVTADRWQKLLTKHAVSTQETDQAVSDLDARRAALSAQEANVRRLQQMQSFEKIYAPFDGVITARNTDIGDLIQAGQNTTPQELFHLSAINRLRIFAPVPEIYQSALRSVKEVRISADAYPNEHFRGTIARTTNAIDAMSRTLKVEVDIDNPQSLLLPGAYVFVHLPLPASFQALTIPSNALLFREEGLRVGVVRKGEVQLVPIAIGRDYGNAVEVTSGLTPGDVVIVNPPDSIVDGTPVQANQGPMEHGV